MQLVAMFEAYGAWSWVVLGLILLGIELAVPGGFFIWLGGSAILTGLLTLILPLEFAVELLLFGVLAVVAIVVWLRFFRSRNEVSESPLLNRRAEQYVGQTGILNEPIISGFGRVKLGDTVWRVSGPDLAAGAHIRVVGADGAVLRVEAA